MQEESKDVLDLEVSEEVQIVKPVYTGVYGKFTWQQERILCFGKTKVFSTFALLQVISLVISVYSFIDLLFLSEEEFGRYLPTQLFIGIIVTMILIYGILKFRKGSHTNDIHKARSGISIFKSIYQLGYALGVFGLVVGGIAILILYLLAMSYQTTNGLIIFIFILVLFAIAIVNLMYLKRVVTFTETMVANIDAKKTNFGYPTPRTSELKPFVIIVIAMWVLALVTLIVLQLSPTYGELLPLNMDLIYLYFILLLNIGIGCYTLYMFTEFNNAMKFNLK